MNILFNYEKYLIIYDKKMYKKITLLYLVIKILIIKLHIHLQIIQTNVIKVFEKNIDLKLTLSDKIINIEKEE